MVFYIIFFIVLFVIWGAIIFLKGHDKLINKTEKFVKENLVENKEENV